MELSNQKRRKQVIILSNVHPANQRESLKKFPSCILIRIRGFICTFARKQKHSTVMVLNYIWIAFFLIAFAVALVRLVFLGDTQVFPEIINSTFSSSKSCIRDFIGIDRRAFTLARNYEDRRERGSHCFVL